MIHSIDSLVDMYDTIDILMIHIDSFEFEKLQTTHFDASFIASFPKAHHPHTGNRVRFLLTLLLAHTLPLFGTDF